MSACTFGAGYFPKHLHPYEGWGNEELGCNNRGSFSLNSMFQCHLLTLFSVNSIIPIIVRLIVFFEKHYREGDAQRSLYVKITFSRWMNTAVITRMITPLLATIGKEKIDLINTVSALMISEMLISPLLRYLDFGSMIARHYLAPRAKTEEELLNCFNGG